MGKILHEIFNFVQKQNVCSVGITVLSRSCTVTGEMKKVENWKVEILFRTILSIMISFTDTNTEYYEDNNHTSSPRISPL